MGRESGVWVFRVSGRSGVERKRTRGRWSASIRALYGVENVQQLTNSVLALFQRFPSKLSIIIIYFPSYATLNKPPI